MMFILLARMEPYLHFDGNEDGEWKTMESGTEEYLLGIWGSSSKNIFAVGDNATILHYDG